jgi:hypothetical protein
MTTSAFLSNWVEVVSLKLGVLPWPISHHLIGQLSLESLSFWSILLTFSNVIEFDSLNVNKLSLFEQVQDFLVKRVYIFCVPFEFLQLNLVLIDDCLSNPLNLVLLLSMQLNPLVFHCLTESNLSNCGIEWHLAFSFSLRNDFTNFETICILKFCGTFLKILFSFSGKFDFLLIKNLKVNVFISD